MLKKRKKNSLEKVKSKHEHIDFRCAKCGYHTFEDLGIYKISNYLFQRLRCKQCNESHFLEKEHHVNPQHSKNFNGKSVKKLEKLTYF